MDEIAPSRDDQTLAVYRARKADGMDAIAARLHLRAYGCERALVLLRRRLTRRRLAALLEIQSAMSELGRARRALREARRVIVVIQSSSEPQEMSFRCVAFAGGCGVARAALSGACTLAPEADRISSDLVALIGDARSAALLARLTPSAAAPSQRKENRSDGL